MAAGTVSSGIITNKLASPPSYNEPGEEGEAKLRSMRGTVEIAATSIDDVGDIVLLFPVRGDDRILSFKIFNDDLDAHACPTLAVNVGLYKDPAADGTSATVVDADAYASAITTLQAANTAGVEIAFEARNISAMGRTVAEDGAETEADVGSALRFVGLTVTTGAATGAAGTVSWVALVERR